MRRDRLWQLRRVPPVAPSERRLEIVEEIDHWISGIGGVSSLHLAFSVQRGAAATVGATA